MSNTFGSIYLEVVAPDNGSMDEYERLQQLLLGIKNNYCGGVAATLARRINKDGSYVNRLFYALGKKGAKGIGPDVMHACKSAFDLPRGFWDMDPSEAFPPGTMHQSLITPPTPDDITIPQFDIGGGMGRPRLMLADQPGVIRSWSVNHEWLRLNVKSYTSPDNLRIVTGFGHSMKPMFNPGDPLLIDVGVDRVDQEGVFFFRVDEDGYIKTLQRIPQEGGGRLLKAKSRNSSEFDDFLINERTMDFHVLGKILTVWKSEQF